ncbi:MAG TPA: carbohydrate ABC transporter permease [Anaerolineae bacterium]|nr:carbohydrate ABC transporter permease [Anaerolineae bacterium]HIQ05478.1 carbohydrate ABC transporter permease [Anaerolineae bacterium]
MNSYRLRCQVNNWGTTGILVIALVAVLFPYYWILLTSLKPLAVVSRPDVWLFPPALTNWQDVLLRSDTPHYLVNSIVVGLVTVAISIGVGSPAAYSFSRFNTGGASTRFGVLAAQMLPPAVLIVPLFLLMHRLALLDTVVAVIAAHLTFILPVVTWFLVGFFDEIPRELEEQAMVDGYTRFQAFHKVILPNIRAGLGAAGIFAFVLSWNDMFYALILTGGKSKTLPVAIAGYWTFRGIEMGKMAVAIVVAIVPVLIASFLVQKHLVKGLGGGALKY